MFFNVIHQISGQEIANFDTNWVFPDCNDGFEMIHKALLFFEVIDQISR